MPGSCGYTMHIRALLVQLIVRSGLTGEWGWWWWWSSWWTIPLPPVSVCVCGAKTNKHGKNKFGKKPDALFCIAFLFCVLLCLYVCKYVCIYVCMYVCTFVEILVCMLLLIGAGEIKFNMP